MAIRKRKFEAITNTGFSTNNTRTEGGRLTNKDGSINLRKVGMPFWERISMYHSLLRMSRGKFLLIVFSFYTTMNIIFATIYMMVGVQHLQGIIPGNDLMTNFQQAFFFSSQTLTTVGYGHISPVGLATNIVASLESFMGILSFALVTGLLYGRFTRPRAYLLFSENVIVAPHKGKRALMARLATFKNNHLTDVEAQVTIAMHVEENGQRVRRFYALPLEISKINSLAINWTMVHLIDEESPLYMMSEEEISKAEVELLYFIKAFDDHFSNIVQQRTSYTFKEMVFGAKYIPMFHRSEDNSTTILDLSKISDHERAELPEMVISSVNA